jgi:8-oxo-dGTP pyrophosphatase MutT (NUDIX family)
MTEPPDLAATEALRDRLRGNLAAFEAREASGSELRRAAVAVAIVEGPGGRACFVITHRASTLRHHAGQYALPGGRIDEGETPDQAALRELHEEVGLELAPEAIIGRLDDFATRSGFAITPVVTWGGRAADLAANPSEVASARAISLDVLERPEVPTLRRIPESDRPVIEIDLGDGDPLWAPAAAILYQLREVGLHGRDTRVAHFEQPLFAWK